MKTKRESTDHLKTGYLFADNEVIELCKLIIDIHLFKGAFLLCMGGNLTNVRVEFNGRKTATFLFTGNDLERYNIDYVTGSALVNPMELRLA